MLILFVISFGILGVLISRLHGGGFFSNIPKFIRNTLWAAPITIITYYCCYNSIDNIIYLIGSMLGVFILCFLGKTTGHGGGIDLGTSDKEPNEGRELEKLEYLIYWLHDKIPRYTYDSLLLAITGLAAVSGAIILFTYLSPLAGMIVALGGVLKSLAYMLGWKIYPKGQSSGYKELDEATEIGEALTGFFAYISIGTATLVVL